MIASRRTISRSVLRAAAIAPAFLAIGCLERVITVTTEPPGAIVYLNDHEVGRSPVSTEFTFFGDYDLRLRLDGYEPYHGELLADAPLHEYPGIDIVTAVLPFKFKTEIKEHVVLTPNPEATLGVEAAADRLADRADAMRRSVENSSRAPVEPVEN